MPFARAMTAIAAVLGSASLATACSKTDKPKPTPAPRSEPTRPAPAVPDAAVAALPCALPTAPASSVEETMWRLFVAAACPTGKPGTPLQFETWTEQTCIANPTAPGCGPSAAATTAVRHLHASRLAVTTGIAPVAASNGPDGQACQPMTTKGKKPDPLDPFVPANLAPNPVFCEEVFTNQPEVSFIQGNGLTTNAKQAAFLLAGNTITFPTSALEVKADWLPSTSLNPPLDCAAVGDKVYVEQIGGTCYVLAGIHLSSKLYPNWGWATFEPIELTTNPNRCDPNLYGECHDPWGATPPRNAKGTPTQLTPRALALIDAAKLPPAFRNYRMTGAQMDFTDKSVTELGSSFTELNAGVDPHQASCITCHSYAQVNKATGALAYRGAPGPTDPAIGPPTPMAAANGSLDFSWLLGVGI